MTHYEQLFSEAACVLDRWELRDPPVGAAKYQVLDLFSGCGGMSAGFAAVGSVSGDFEVVGGCDINQYSATSYSRNFGGKAICGDVRALALEPGALERFLADLPNYQSARETVLVGCAPCQGFSAHGKKRWDRRDSRNSLLFAFAQVAIRLQPVAIVMENVPEMLSFRYWDDYTATRDLLESAGYIVKAAIHNTAAFGVPQRRFRALVVATRGDFTMPAPVLSLSTPVTVRAAISDLPPVAAGQVLDVDPMHRSARHRPGTIEVIRQVPLDGGSRPAGVGPKCLDRTTGFSDVYGRLSWDAPAITITHYARNPASGRYVHPEQDRGLTAREAARLQSFPDAFQFAGGFDDVFRQIGEAVPPLFATAVASSVLCSLKGIRSVGSSQEVLIEAPVTNSYSSTISGQKMRNSA